MSNASKQSEVPRAIIHKQILDVASDRPDASLNAIAADVPGAATDLVERVLDEYGDPAEAQSDTHLDQESSQMAHSNNIPNPDELSAKERETLKVILENPQKSQREIAELLDVSAPTVSTRVNGIEGFQWADRQTFVKEVFEVESTRRATKSASMMTNDTEASVKLDQLSERIATLEQQVENHTGEMETSVFADAELLHKVIRACFDSESITEEEELRILEVVLR